MDKIQWVAEHFYDHRWQASEHAHADKEELLLVLSGRMRVQFADRAVEGGPGLVVCYPRNCVHRERSIGSGQLRLWCVAFSHAGPLPLASRDTFGRASRGLGWIRDLQLTGVTDAAVQGIWSAVLHEVRLGESSSANTNGEPAMIAVRAYLQEHLHRRISLDALADVAGLSRSRFVECFRAAVGTSPVRYLRQVRMERARQLLATTNLPLKAIAPRVGLRDEFELCRTFKRECGIAPSSARRASSKRRA
ncbi:hypothetical protein BH10PLA1_BH10PLA1_22010 [soil metagenome]